MATQVNYREILLNQSRNETRAQKKRSADILNEPVEKILCNRLHDTIKADEKTPKAEDESDQEKVTKTLIILIKSTERNSFAIKWKEEISNRNLLPRKFHGR